MVLTIMNVKRATYIFQIPLAVSLLYVELPEIR
jgi:hypothetical protein